MGAADFYTVRRGKDAREAFDAAVQQARWEHGHGGYTGTIAEKNAFVMIPVPADEQPLEYARKLVDTDDQRIANKWGPAGCIDLGKEKFLFFGWASE